MLPFFFHRLLWHQLHWRMLIKPVWTRVLLHQEAELLPWLHLWLPQPLLWPLLREEVQFSTFYVQLCHRLSRLLLRCMFFGLCRWKWTKRIMCFAHRTDLPCPRGWWGHKTCGPCNCQTDKGFDSDCNKTSGECRCKVSWADLRPTFNGCENARLVSTLSFLCL